MLRERPGTALCYWPSQMRSDKSTVHPDLVVLAFFGNLGSCTEGRGDLTTVYTHDVRVTAEIWAGTPTVWASAPGKVGSRGDNPITPIIRAEAASSGQHFVDAGAALGGPDGSWPRTFPCRGSETSALGCQADGRIVVRTPSPDTVHLCTVSYNPFVVGPCPAPYASGIERWIGAIATGADPSMEPAPRLRSPPAPTAHASPLPPRSPTIVPPTTPTTRPCTLSVPLLGCLVSPLGG